MKQSLFSRKISYAYSLPIPYLIGVSQLICILKKKKSQGHQIWWRTRTVAHPVDLEPRYAGGKLLGSPDRCLPTRPARGSGRTFLEHSPPLKSAHGSKQSKPKRYRGRQDHDPLNLGSNRTFWQTRRSVLASRKNPDRYVRPPPPPFPTPWSLPLLDPARC